MERAGAIQVWGRQFRRDLIGACRGSENRYLSEGPIVR